MSYKKAWIPVNGFFCLKILKGFCLYHEINEKSERKSVLLGRSWKFLLCCARTQQPKKKKKKKKMVIPHKKICHSEENICCCCCCFFFCFFLFFFVFSKSWRNVKWQTILSVHQNCFNCRQCCTDFHLKYYMSRLITKPTKWLCPQRWLRLAWASAQSDQSSLGSVGS